ncbi:hypothetical protein [Saccharothrix xinjiangensis]|uniref:DUF3558 domain-containing protein n=1 Tax=Saccharothrix xinjiangensis TaxID=204798 RepID=A0ABV9XV68_9PSEU
MTEFSRLVRSAAMLATTGSLLLGVPAVAVGEPSSGALAPGTASNDGARIVLGDLDPVVDAAAVGAPFDPCRLGWQAFPEQVRPDTPKSPRLRPPKDSDIFSTACRYDNSGAAVFKPGEQATAGAAFITVVAWAAVDDGMSANPADHSNAAPARFGGKEGLLKSGANAGNGAPMCTAILSLANGVAGITVTNARFPAVDTCTIAQTVGNAVAATAP